MGLDQTAYTKDKDGEVEDLAYWRKHNALDGWMEALWRTKGNDGEWNCSELELTLEDIKQLETVVVNDSLPETHGFFYGDDSRFNEYKKEETLEFIETANRTLKDGKKVFYQCWF